MSYPYFLSYMTRVDGQVAFSSRVCELKNEIRSDRHLRAVEKKLAKEIGIDAPEVTLLDAQNLVGTGHIASRENIRYFCSYVAEDGAGSTVIEYPPILSNQADMSCIENRIQNQTGIQKKLRVLTIHPLTIVFDGGASA